MAYFTHNPYDVPPTVPPTLSGSSDGSAFHEPHSAATPNSCKVHINHARLPQHSDYPNLTPQNVPSLVFSGVAPPASLSSPHLSFPQPPSPLASTTLLQQQQLQLMKIHYINQLQHLEHLQQLQQIQNVILQPPTPAPEQQPFFPPSNPAPFVAPLSAEPLGVLQGCPAMPSAPVVGVQHSGAPLPPLTPSMCSGQLLAVGRVPFPTYHHMKYIDPPQDGVDGSDLPLLIRLSRMSHYKQKHVLSDKIRQTLSEYCGMCDADISRACGLMLNAAVTNLVRALEDPQSLLEYAEACLARLRQVGVRDDDVKDEHANEEVGVSLRGSIHGGKDGQGINILERLVEAAASRAGCVAANTIEVDSASDGHGNVPPTSEVPTTKASCPPSAPPVGPPQSPASPAKASKHGGKKSNTQHQQKNSSCEPASPCKDDLMCDNEGNAIAKSQNISSTPKNKATNNGPNNNQARSGAPSGSDASPTAHVAPTTAKGKNYKHKNEENQNTNNTNKPVTGGHDPAPLPSTTAAPADSKACVAWEHDECDVEDQEGRKKFGRHWPQTNYRPYNRGYGGQGRANHGQSYGQHSAQSHWGPAERRGIYDHCNRTGKKYFPHNRDETAVR